MLIPGSQNFIYCIHVQTHTHTRTHVRAPPPPALTVAGTDQTQIQTLPGSEVDRK